MTISSPYAVFRANPWLRTEPDLPPKPAASRRRVAKALAPIKAPAAWATLIQGNLFDQLPPLRGADNPPLPG